MGVFLFFEGLGADVPPDRAACERGAGGGARVSRAERGGLRAALWQDYWQKLVGLCKVVRAVGRFCKLKKLREVPEQCGTRSF